MGRRSRRTVTPSTWGILPLAKAPSLRKDWSKGTQRTRKLSTGGDLWSLAKCEGTLCGEVEPQRTTEGAEPYAVQTASTVLNGGDEETGQKALRLVPTQR